MGYEKHGILASAKNQQAMDDYARGHDPKTQGMRPTPAGYELSGLGVEKAAKTAEAAEPEIAETPMLDTLGQQLMRYERLIEVARVLLQPVLAPMPIDPRDVAEASTRLAGLVSGLDALNNEFDRLLSELRL